MTKRVDRMNDKIRIHKKRAAKGEDNHKTFSIRIKDDVVDALDALASKSNRSRNELISIILEHAVQNIEIIDD